MVTRRPPRPNRHAGPCTDCGQTVPAGAGFVHRNLDGGWDIHHPLARWAGSPVSGRFVGGCPPKPPADHADQRGQDQL